VSLSSNSREEEKAVQSQPAGNRGAARLSQRRLEPGVFNLAIQIGEGSNPWPQEPLGRKEVEALKHSEEVGPE